MHHQCLVMILLINLTYLKDLAETPSTLMLVFAFTGIISGTFMIIVLSVILIHIFSDYICKHSVCATTFYLVILSIGYWTCLTLGMTCLTQGTELKVVGR